MKKIIILASVLFCSTAYASYTPPGTPINATLIGNTSAADATFSTIRATKMDATKIGTSSAADATFTALSIGSVTTVISNTGTITSNLNGSRNVQSRLLMFPVSTTIAAPTATTGNNCAGDFSIQIPAYLNGFKVSTVTASVTTAASSGTITANIKNRTTGNNILSTALTIDATERSSTTAATPAVINAATRTLSTDDDVCVQVSVAGTGASGLQVSAEIQP